MYTHEDCLQEARTMLTDMTIEDPTSPARKKNRQEEYSECQDEPVIDEACKRLITKYKKIRKKKITFNESNLICKLIRKSPSQCS